MTLSKERFLEITSGFKNISPVLVIGDIGVDKYTFGHVARISPEAPVPVLEVSREWEKLGLAANVSDNLSCLEVTSTLCGVIGEDKNGASLESLLEASKLKTWGVVRSPDRMTTYKERVVTELQQICRVDYETKTDIDHNTLEKLQNRLSEFKESHGAIIVEDYGKGVVSEKLLSFLINNFKKDHLIAIDPSRTTPPLWYKGAHLLKPNRVEAEMMASSLGFNREKNIETIARLLCDKLALQKIIITLGAEGMALIDTQTDGKMKVIPTAASEVFDVSGAGDTAISAIVASLEAKANLEEAAWIGNCASGVVVGKKGTAKVDLKELTRFFEKLNLMS